MTDSDRSNRLKKILYRASHRGFKEADLVIGRFAERELATMNDDELAAFERLLGEPDHDLYAWILGKAPVPTAFDTPVFRRLVQSLREAG